MECQAYCGMVEESAEIGRLAAHVTEAPATFAASRLYQAFCPAVAQDRPTLELLTGRLPGQQPSYLLFGAVHYLLLTGAQHPLRTFYPSLAGAAAAGPDGAGPVLLGFCRAYEDELRQLIRTRLVQTNVVKRAAGLRVALWAVGRQCARPVHLIEVGASAGVHLLFDRYCSVVGGREFGPRASPVRIETQWRGQEPPPDLDDLPPIASRRGIDLRPADSTDFHERMWLRALVWPERRDQADLLASALELVASDPPTIIPGDAIDVCPALGASLPAGEPRVVFHAATRMHVPADRRAAFDAAIDSIGQHGPLYHVWQEPPSAQHEGAPPSETGTLMSHGPAPGTFAALMRVDGHLDWMAPLDTAS
jgi:hypothetical protein